MAKQITFTYKGQDFTLEFNRETVKRLEDQEIYLADIRNRTMTILPELFRGAFRLHHRNLKKEYIDEIFKCLGNKEELLEKLTEIYLEPYNELMDEPEEGDENFINWEMKEN